MMRMKANPNRKCLKCFPSLKIVTKASQHFEIDFGRVVAQLSSERQANHGAHCPPFVNFARSEGMPPRARDFPEIAVRHSQT